MHENPVDTCIIDSDKDTYGITVSPNVDYALVVSLMVILYEVNKDSKKKKIQGKKKGGGSSEIIECKDEDEEEEDDDEEDDYSDDSD